VQPDPTSSQAPPAAAPVIERTAVYSVEQLRAALALNQTTLDREIRKGRLRCAKRAGRRWVLGVWVLQWLAGGEKKRPERRGRAQPPPRAGRNGAARQG
jgi:hypothetical protein